MVTWVGDGNFGQYDPTVDRLAFGQAFFATFATVDSQFVTRLQYLGTNAGPPAPNRVVARCTFNFTGSEVGIPNDGNYARRAAMFIVPETYFGKGVIPTRQDIYDGSSYYGFIVEGTLRSGSWNDVAEVDFVGPTTSQLVPGAKYWAMVMPTWSRVVHPPFIPRTETVRELTGLPPNTIGRAISFWTNRGPGKPTITTPGGLYLSGDVIPLAWVSGDLDGFLGDDEPNYTDTAGAQVQFATKMGGEWSNLPYQGIGGFPGESWCVDQGPSMGGLAPDGLDQDALKGFTNIQAGKNAPTLDAHAAMPAGDWQIRVRTFDYGHPGFGAPIVGGSVGTKTIYNYPAFNTSPWSDPIVVSIPAQVPQPDALSPRDKTAITTGTLVTLKWRYKNTAAPMAGSLINGAISPSTITSLTVDAIPIVWPVGLRLRLANGQIARVATAASIGATSITISSLAVTKTIADNSAIVPFPYPQASRTIQMRKSGDDWTTVLTADVSDTPTWTVTGFDLSEVGQYEWRVMATDSDGKFSEFSEPALFWIVPVPSSGSVIPPADQALTGAQLGCGVNRAFIYRRGGTTRVAEVTEVSYLDWGRLRDDISTAKVRVSGWSEDCGNLLANLQTWAYEVIIFRDNGFSNDRVWEGPITLLRYEADQVEIEAKDVIGYLYRRILTQKMADLDGLTTIVERAVQVIQNALAPDDPNLLAYLKAIVNDSDKFQNRSTAPYSRTAYEEIDDMAARGGLDYAAVGRAILVWGTKSPIGKLPELRDEHLGESPIVTEYGMEFANRYVVSDGNGVYGEANRLGPGGVDPVYGLVEILSTTSTEEEEPIAGTYTPPDAVTKESYEGYAESAISDRYPPPVVVRIPDNTSLNSTTPVTIQQLVPGVTVPLRSTRTLRKVVGDQKLDSIKVVQTDKGEVVSITLSPFGNAENIGQEG